MRHNILLVDDDRTFLESMSLFLKNEGFHVYPLTNGDEAIALIRQGIISFSVALIDYHMPESSGPETIRSLRSMTSKLNIFAFSGDDSNFAYNNSLDSGATFFIEKTISDQKLIGLLLKACKEVESLLNPVVIVDQCENQKLIASIGMIGISNEMANIAKLIKKMAPTNETVLIRGEHGTGKEKIAKAVHQHSSRKDAPFIAVNCAAIAPNLIESELFGHEKGSYTGAMKSRKGYFEAANGGTIFLDEIGDLPKHLQATLLRVLQEKKVTPVGSNETRKVDFRLVAATNAPLEQLMKEKLFREDLFFRLNVFNIQLTPLRDRPSDILILAKYFVDSLNAEQKENKVLLASTVEKLKKLNWVGNVRELEHFMHVLYQLSDSEIIDDSPLDKKQAVELSAPATLEALKFSKMKDEKNIILKALTETGTILGASKMLNLSRSTIREKMRKYGIILNNELNTKETVL